MSDPPWQNEERLRELYHDKRMNTVEIAERFGCSDVTIGEWLDRFDIEKRSLSEAKRLAALRRPPRIEINTHGYMICRTVFNDQKDQFPVHRLLAVAEYGFDEVVGKVVHHTNHIPWDNRPENLELMDWSEHSKHHSLKYWDDGPWRNEEALRDAYRDATRQELADRWGCGRATIDRWLDKFGISKDDYDTETDPWREEDRLREAYRDATIQELADRWGCSETTITNWLNRFEIRKCDLAEG